MQLSKPTCLQLDTQRKAEHPDELAHNCEEFLQHLEDQTAQRSRRIESHKTANTFEENLKDVAENLGEKYGATASSSSAAATAPPPKRRADQKDQMLQWINQQLRFAKQDSVVPHVPKGDK